MQRGGVQLQQQVQSARAEVQARAVALLRMAAKGCISWCEQSSELKVGRGKGTDERWPLAGVEPPGVKSLSKSTVLQLSAILTQLCGHACSHLFEWLMRQYFQS